MTERNRSAPVTGDAKPPLVVDLDQTLIRTDILWESVTQLWRRPGIGLRALAALVIRGKAEFKTVLAEHIRIEPELLPYREDVLDFVRAQRQVGRKVILATATHRSFAQPIADYLGVFDEVFATQDHVNLSGKQKQAKLEAAFGKQGFDYIGDHFRDLPVFSSARQAILVSPSRALRRKAVAIANVTREFSEKRQMWKTVSRAMRIHQWTKNALLAVPLLAAHRIFDPAAWTGVLIAFVCLSLVASATYLLNDLVDLRSDRLHPKKRFRPLASGLLTIQGGMSLAICLGLLGFCVSFALLPATFTTYVAIYVLLTLAYSLDLKRRLLVDVMTLAALYTLRILAGGAAIGVVVSEWLLMFSLFMFISLAFLKRAIEISTASGEARISGRGYSPVDLETIRVVGISAGLTSVLVLTLYISSPAVAQLYRVPHVLWLVCPLMIYWIARIWFMAARGDVHHDPVVFALQDWRSYLVGAFAAVIAVFAKIGTSGLPW